MHSSSHLWCLDDVATPTPSAPKMALSLWIGTIQMPKLESYVAGDMECARLPNLRRQSVSGPPQTQALRREEESASWGRASRLCSEGHREKKPVLTFKLEAVIVNINSKG